MQTLNIQISDIAQQINKLDVLAKTHAVTAVEYARQAGHLLLKVKADLPHGCWTAWVENNLTVSLRQAQRYIAVAQGKTVAARQIAGENDMMSCSTSTQALGTVTPNEGEWVNGVWRPLAGSLYIFEEGATYWVCPSEYHDRWFHVSAFYHGQCKSTKEFIRRYTIFAPITDSDCIYDQYIGTTTPLGWLGVGKVLQSYGLKDIRGSMTFGADINERFSRPFGEPSPNTFYEDWHDIALPRLENTATA